MMEKGWRMRLVAKCNNCNDVKECQGREQWKKQKRGIAKPQPK